MEIKKVLFVITLMNLSFFALGQDISFVDLSPLPSERGAVASANDGDHIYVVNGFGKGVGYATEIFKYDILTDTWSLLTSSSIAKRFASAAIVDDKLYVFNGNILGGGLNEKVEVVDLNDGSVSFATDNPNPARAGGVSVWEGKIYSFGGAFTPTSYSDKLYQFDPQTQVWTKLADMPIGAETKGEIIDGKLYVFGGYNGATSDRIDIYNIAADTWESELVMPVKISAHATAVVGTEIYLVGDYSNLNSMASFETINNSFEILTNNLNSRRHCAAEGVGGRLYVMGGNTESDIASSISGVQAVDITTGVNDFELISGVHLFPNPASKFLTWNFRFDRVEITDSKGKIMSILNGDESQIDISHFPEGIFFFSGKKEGQIFRASWVKIKG